MALDTITHRETEQAHFVQTVVQSVSLSDRLCNCITSKERFNNAWSHKQPDGKPDRSKLHCLATDWTETSTSQTAHTH